jgi:hypothetical protein
MMGEKRLRSEGQDEGDQDERDGQSHRNTSCSATPNFQIPNPKEQAVLGVGGWALSRFSNS